MDEKVIGAGYIEKAQVVKKLLDESMSDIEAGYIPEYLRDLGVERIVVLADAKLELHRNGRVWCTAYRADGGIATVSKMSDDILFSPISDEDAFLQSFNEAMALSEEIRELETELESKLFVYLHGQDAEINVRGHILGTEIDELEAKIEAKHDAMTTKLDTFRSQSIVAWSNYPGRSGVIDNGR